MATQKKKVKDYWGTVPVTGVYNPPASPIDNAPREQTYLGRLIQPYYCRRYSADIADTYAGGETLVTVPEGKVFCVTMLNIHCCDTNAIPIGALVCIMTKDAYAGAGDYENSILFEIGANAASRYSPVNGQLCFSEPFPMVKGPTYIKVVGGIGCINTYVTAQIFGFFMDIV
jgi:hypothetical protein